jgi:hypothetical protein
MVISQLVIKKVLNHEGVFKTNLGLMLICSV